MSDVPICAECKHLIGVRLRTEDSRNWKCAKTLSGNDLVTGAPVYELTCYAARSAVGFPVPVCGLEGKFFELYQQSAAPAPVGKPSRSLPSADDLLGELGQ